MIQYGVHFDPPESDDSRRKPGVQSTGRGFESCTLQRRVSCELKMTSTFGFRRFGVPFLSLEQRGSWPTRQFSQLTGGDEVWCEAAQK